VSHVNNGAVWMDGRLKNKKLKKKKDRKDGVSEVKTLQKRFDLMTLETFSQFFFSFLLFFFIIWPMMDLLRLGICRWRVHSIEASSG
jgi:hypothetical protein